MTRKEYRGQPPRLHDNDVLKQRLLEMEREGRFPELKPYPRVSPITVTVDKAFRLPKKQLTELLALHDIRAEPWMFRLEGRVGGMTVGSREQFGFRNAFYWYLQDGELKPLPQTPGGQPLIAFGLDGDTYTYLTLAGAVWAQDDIWQPYPLPVAASFDEMSRALDWPLETRDS